MRRPYDALAVRQSAIIAAMIALCLATIVAINVVCIARAPSTYQQGN